MGKGKKILIGLISIIIILIIAVIGIYFVSFRPKVETTPVNGTVHVDTVAIAKKFIPSDIKINKNGVSATSNVKLNSSELTNLAAYAVSKSPTATKYITGLKVATDNNNHLVVYVTGKLNNIPSQAKINFSVKSEDGSAVLHYDGGKVGFISIPKSLIFDKLRSNNYIHIDKNNGDITINPQEIKGLNIKDISVNKSDLDIELNEKIKSL
ncbi:cytochrome c oxidase assembly factor Coa1 family protein [Clostridium sp.]|uniref:cytochrome c oxidase assembly factor Coa1 family protein n=1 Tax=Clostridium sp. TaxID=1506 RepID=UPI003991021D